MRRIPAITVTVPLLAVCVVLAAAFPARATTIQRMNIAKLIENSDLIVSGSVVALADGFDTNNLPYTEITLQIDDAVKGAPGGSTYTFRQFGLMAPKVMPNGQVYVGVSPDGWPHFELGEAVIVFLHPRTSLGFQSAAGLVQGKFTIRDDFVRNDLDNVGLFAGLSIDTSKMTEAEIKMTRMSRGRCSAQTFKGFVRKAVAEGWFVQNDGKLPGGVKRDQK